jgi:hypothetical protein
MKRLLIFVHRLGVALCALFSVRLSLSYVGSGFSRTGKTEAAFSGGGVPGSISRSARRPSTSLGAP